ncbi:hypothetical protein C8R43DRAFT_1004776 [Mycena crocata]|nr:hypothetical protein C8R43DRAFT_1004776 [Mycena crocata]
MPNPGGKNGAGVKNYPSDDVLKNHFWIMKTKLGDIERRLDIPSVRRSKVPSEVAAQAVADEIDKDLNQSIGPNFVRSKLKDKLIMVYRHPLSALGPFHEVSSDGHEKLGQQALKMGDVGLPIYAWKDKWTADLLKMNVVPNCRTNAAIGHLFIDFIEEQGGIGLQKTTDLGSEIGWLKAIQIFLRERFAPDIDLDIYPAHAGIKSVHNTIIEAFWRWLRVKLEINLFDHVIRGKTEQIFDPNVAFHRDLFNWIFPPLIQGELDEFRVYWNQHRIRAQPNKTMPSGHVPVDALEHPEIYGGINCFIKIPKETIDNLREVLTQEVGPRSDHLQWVDNEFSSLAESVHKSIGSPKITLNNSWEIFAQMSICIEELGNDVE